MASNDNVVDRISDKEFKRMTIGMINKIEEDMNKYLKKF
jgi:hypothetical protein